LALMREEKAAPPPPVTTREADAPNLNTTQDERDEWLKYDIGHEVRRLIEDVNALNAFVQTNDSAVSTAIERCAKVAKDWLDTFGHKTSDPNWQYAVDAVADIHDAIRNLAPEAAIPKINIRCECTENGITGTTYLNVTGVEREDDGSFTAVTDHWPMPAIRALSTGGKDG
jgi:hypothetical protein